MLPVDAFLTTGSSTTRKVMLDRSGPQEMESVEQDRCSGNPSDVDTYLDFILIWKPWPNPSNVTARRFAR
jgi:hypothetical protein